MSEEYSYIIGRPDSKSSQPLHNVQLAAQRFTDVYVGGMSYSELMERQRYTEQDYSISFWGRDGIVGVSVIRQVDFPLEETRRLLAGWVLLENVERVFHLRREEEV